MGKNKLGAKEILGFYEASRKVLEELEPMNP
jgi:hypothetical protein